MRNAMKYNLFKSFPKLVVIWAVSSFLLIILFVHLCKCQLAATHSVELSAFGLVIDLFWGVPIQSAHNNIPGFPTLWLTGMAIVLAPTVAFIEETVDNESLVAIVLSKKRWVFWFSKCIIITLYTLFSCCIVVAAALSAIMLLGLDPCIIGLDVSDKLTMLGNSNSAFYAAFRYAIPFFLGLCGLTSLLMLLSGFFGGINSFALIIVYLCFTTSFSSELFLGNYCMFERLNDSLMPPDYFSFVVAFLLIITTAFFVLGGILYARKDFVLADRFSAGQRFRD